MSTDILEFNDSLKHHYETEEKIVKQLLALEREFRSHNELMKTEMQLQKELIDRIWILSQRYILLESTGPCCRHPEIYTGPAEDTLLQEFNDKLKQIRASNRRVHLSIDGLRKSCLVFEDLCKQLDMTIESALIIGDTFHKPISYFMELITDLFKYFHAWLLKLKYTSHLVDPSLIDSIESYKKQLAISEDFEEHLNVGLTYCKCLRPKQSCLNSI